MRVFRMEERGHIWNDSSDLGSVCLRYAWLVDKNQSVAFAFALVGVAHLQKEKKRTAQMWPQLPSQSHCPAWLPLTLSLCLSFS